MILIFFIYYSISLTRMVQTRSQTKKQEEEEANNDCIGEECDGHCNADDEEEVSWIKKDGVWNLIYDMYGTYYVVTDNYYTEQGDNYHEFKAKDYDGGEPTAYRQALMHYNSRV